MNAYELANLAGVATPDKPLSPGAVWLVRVHGAAAEYLENWNTGKTPDTLDDDIHELADSLVPVYTHPRWEVFVDLAAYTEDIDELGQSGDMTMDAGMALYMIAERLIFEIVEQARDAA